MARVTVRQVRELIPTSAENDAILHSYINTANVYVDANLLTAGHGTTILEQIELYLSAHFTAIFEERGAIVEETLGDATDEYADIYAPGLQSTRFGQQAVILDTSGTLARLGSPKLKARFGVIGSC